MIKNFAGLLFRPTRMIVNDRFSFGEDFAILKRQKEAQMAKKLKETLNPTYLQVTDTTLSGSSCGQMYRITIQSPVFQGKSKVVQHQMVSECLAEELKSIHAFNLKTKVPKKAEETVAKQASTEPKQQTKQQ